VRARSSVRRKRRVPIVLTRAGVGFVVRVLVGKVDVGSAVDVRHVGGDHSIRLTGGVVDDDGNVLAIAGAIRDRRIR
jgi:hypothetical protein